MLGKKNCFIQEILSLACFPLAINHQAVQTASAYMTKSSEPPLRLDRAWPGTHNLVQAYKSKT